MRKDKINSYLVVGSIMLIIMLCFMILSFFYTPYEPNQMDVVHRYEAPSGMHLFGTDEFGRDIFSRILYGSRFIFLIGLFSMLFGLFIGLTLGALAGYYGGLLDDLLMKVVDTQMAFPGILLALMLIAVFGTNITSLMIAIGLISIPRFTRVIRSGVIKRKNLDYVLAAKSRGAGNFRIIYLHIIPNMMPEILITCSLGFSSAIMAEAGLSYLGLGVQPPNPSWGQMLSGAQRFIAQAPWYPIIPGLFITITILGFNMLADGLRDYYDKLY